MAVTIASLLANNGRRQFQLIAVLDERDAEGENRLRTTVSQFHNAEIEFKVFGTSSFSNLRIDGHISLASYLRLFMTEFLGPHLDKVIYLDCDLIVCDDLEELWNTDISGHFLAAVADPYGDNHVALGFREEERYFNAGVLLVNLIKWREADVTPRLVAYAKENFDIVRYWDQDTLNAVFRGQVLFLPPRWNFQARNADLPAWVLGLNQEEFALLRKNPSIVHYTTHVKPWLYQQEPHYKQLYYKYLALTPWRDFKPANRTVRTALTKFVRMEKLKQLIKWRLPELFRSVRQWTGRGSPFLRKLQGQLPR